MVQDVDEWLRSFIDASPMPMWLLDEHHTLVHINVVALKRFGYTRSELIEKSLNQIVPAFLRQLHELDVSAGDASGFARDPRPPYRVEGLLKNGELATFTLEASTLESQGCAFELQTLVELNDRFETEATTRLLLSLSSQSQQLAIENARLRNEITNFSYVVSHDLQEPLRKIVMSCEALMQDHSAEVSPAIKRWVDFAVSGAVRMQQMVKDLLAYSRVGVPPRSSQAVSAMDAVHVALSRLQTEIDQSQARVAVEKLPAVFVDESLLVQLFYNLISNALKFRGKLPLTLEIGSVANPSGEDSEPVFFVRDSGIGILPEYFDRIFLVFQRLHSRENYAGTGIGLAICKKIVERHDGKIWVESEIDRGSTFYFRLGH